MNIIHFLNTQFITLNTVSRHPNPWKLIEDPAGCKVENITTNSVDPDEMSPPSGSSLFDLGRLFYIGQL